MADPKTIDFSAVGGKPVTQPPTGGLDFSSVGGKPVTTPGVPDPSTENVQPPVAPQPSALSRFGNSAAEALGKGSLGNTNEEVKARLKEIAQHPIDSTLQFGKGVADAQGELAYKAKDAWQKGDHVGAAAYALYYMMPGIGPALAKSGEQAASGDYAGAAGTFAGTVGPALATEGLKPETSVPKTGFKAAQEAGAREAAVKPAPKTVSAVETAPKAEPLQAAGEKVQAEAKATRDAAGKKVGAAKEAVNKSLEEKRQIPAASSEATKSLQKLSIAKTPLKPTALTDATDDVLKDTADTEQLAGAKDPDMADARAMAEHLSKGENAAGEPLSLDPEHVDSVKRAFNNKIDALTAKVQAGGNGAALRHIRNLKQAWQSDLYDAYEEHGDPGAAQALKAASKEYAGIVNDQTSGPARAMFRNQSPEKIVSTIVGSGARSQSAVESLMRNMSKDGQETLRDSVLKEIYRKNTLPDGTIDMVKARKNFYSMGDTAKTLYGDQLKPTTDYLDAASKEQAARNAKATKPSIVSNVKTKVTKAAGAGGGAFVGGTVAGAPGAVGGAIAGSELADAVFQNGKSGAVRIGISPTERIVLSPAEATAKRPMITKFLKAKAAGNVSAIAAAYNAISQPARKTDK